MVEAVMIFLLLSTAPSARNRSFRGVSPACPPPVTGRSASFRLRFRFARAVRAGEAKLRGRIQTVILIAGPSGCEYPGVRGVCGRLFA